jgi:glyoxylase-like metal-dependent hydrolase (beta-lactamase superfamily II)
MIYKTVQLAPDLWAIEETMVRCFLLHGKKGTLLLDACVSGGDKLCVAVNAVTGGAKMQIALTHSDRDHTGGLLPEDSVFVHPAEFEHLGTHGFAVTPLWESDVFEAGNRTLKPILMPGHTPGSTAFVDHENKKIFIGDTVSNSHVFMFGSGRNLPAYIASLEFLSMNFSGYSFYACHGEAEVPPEQLTAQLECAKKVLAGEIAGEEPPHNLPCKLYRYGGAAVLY